MSRRWVAAIQHLNAIMREGISGRALWNARETIREHEKSMRQLWPLCGETIPMEQWCADHGYTYPEAALSVYKDGYAYHEAALPIYKADES